MSDYSIILPDICFFIRDVGLRRQLGWLTSLSTQRAGTLCSVSASARHSKL